MAYLFLSQHHKTNAGEWSCETYSSKDDTTVSAHSFSSFSSLLLIFDCLLLDRGVICIKHFCIEFKTAPVTYCKIFENIMMVPEWLLWNSHVLKGLLTLKPAQVFKWTEPQSSFFPLTSLSRPSCSVFVLTVCSKPEPGPHVCWPDSKTQLTSERGVLG